ncbi:MAG TPA: tetratricopeptide repeat protein, partial [Chthoniobacterales bacterium]|nr:tetratricopeptide repeat protein [Chthoniobacterales bacterium]
NLYKSGNPRNLREIGEQLGVAHVLEGSVQRTGNKLRVHAQLIDTRQDTQLWAQTYDRDVADVFAIQSAIASAIAGSLQAKLAPEEKTRLALKPTENTDAYLLYLQANELIRVARSKVEAVNADQLYAQAIALDPHFALAVARASMLNSLMFHVGREPVRKERARALAEEALRLAPDLGEAHLALGLCFYRIDLDYDAALKELAIAAAALPNDSEVLDASGFIYRRQGRWRDALGMFQRAQNLDPRRPHFDGAPDTLRVLRQWAPAADAYNHALQLDPNLPEGWIGLAYVQFAQSGKPAVAIETLAHVPEAQKNKAGSVAERFDYAMMTRDFVMAESIAADAPEDEFAVLGPKAFFRACIALAHGEPEQAHALFEEIRPLYETAARDHPDDPKFLAPLAKVYALLGRKEEAIRIARRAVDLCPATKDAGGGPIYETNLAFVYAQSGEVDQAVTLLSHLLTTPGADRITLAHLRLSWEWDPLRKDPGFQKILERPEPKTIY